MSNTTLLILGPVAFGMAMGATMFWLFDAVLRRSWSTHPVRDLGIVFSWFVGGEAVVFGTFKVFDLPQLLQIPAATAVAFLAYLVGFGVSATARAYFKEPPRETILEQVLADPAIQVALFINAFGFKVEDAAAHFNKTETEIKQMNLEGLRKIVASRQL